MRTCQHGHRLRSRDVKTNETSPVEDQTSRGMIPRVLDSLSKKLESLILAQNERWRRA